jgi:outer membrane protein TolC
MANQHTWRWGLGAVAAAVAATLVQTPLGLSAEAPKNPRPAIALWPTTRKASSQPTSAGALPASRPTRQPATSRPAAMPGSNAVTSPAKEALELTVAQAILMALENNKALVVQRYNPDIKRTLVEQQRAVFDPDLTAAFSASHSRTDEAGSDSISKSVAGDIGLTQSLPTGTDLDLSLSADGTLQSGDDEYTSRLALTATQSLLRGFGTAVNLASLRQARVDVLTSQYELRGYAETLVSDVEKAYWNYALARRQTEIVVQSLKIAEDQLTNTQERVRVGKLAGAQLAAAEAEVALRKEELINARSTEDKALLTLLRLLSPPDGQMYRRPVTILDPPIPPQVELGSIDLHVQTAMQQRPDLNQARLQINRGDLEIVKTRNGLLPLLDLFITLGKTGYAESFGSSMGDMFESKSYDITVGLEFEQPPLNRSAKALHRKAVLTRDQYLAALANQAQLAELDVRTAYIEVLRTREQVSATAATRKAQEEVLRVEMARFQAEKSTSLLVNIAQRDLLSSRVAEVQAVVNYLKALVDLYRLEGSLLERRGIAAPGGAPVELVLPPVK